MFFGKKKYDQFNVVITLEALEVAMEPKFLKKNVNEQRYQYITMVIKRGKQQRHETMGEHLKYLVLEQNEKAISQNRKNYL